jgi:hypothetical protein
MLLAGHNHATRAVAPKAGHAPEPCAQVRILPRALQNSLPRGHRPGHEVEADCPPLAWLTAALAPSNTRALRQYTCSAARRASASFVHDPLSSSPSTVTCQPPGKERHW